MTDVQLIFDALPSLIKTENYDALYQVIHSKNEISDMKCLNHSSCKTLKENMQFLNKWLYLDSKHSMDWSWILCSLIEIPCLQDVIFFFCFLPISLSQAVEFETFILYSNIVQIFSETSLRKQFRGLQLKSWMMCNLFALIQALKVLISLLLPTEGICRALRAPRHIS